MQTFECFLPYKMQFYVLNGRMGHLCLHKNDLYAHLIRKPLGLAKNTRL